MNFTRFSGTLRAERRWSISVGMILLLGVVMYFGFLGGYPLADPDEGRYAEIAREMLESRDFVTPHLNYVKYLEKPPLFYWLVAASFAVFGENEWAIRSVSAMAGLLSALLVISLGRRMFGPRTGLTAGWVYLTSVQPFVLARLPIIDMLFSLCLAATWGAWWLGYLAHSLSERKRYYALSWACLGLATMSKGLAAIVLTGLIILIFISVRRNWAGLGGMAWWPGPLLFAVIVAPWHLVVGYRNPEFWHFYIVVQHFGRISGNEHVKPFWFYVVSLPFGMMFWGAFLFPMAANAIKCCYHTFKSPSIVPLEISEGRPNHIASNRIPETWQAGSVLFLVIWATAVVGLFSLCQCKLFPYVLPAFPALALLVAWHLDSGALDSPSTGWCLASTAILLVGLILSLPYAARHHSLLPFKEISGLLLTTQCALLLGTALVVFSAFRRRMVPLAVGLVLVLLMPMLSMSAQVITKYRKIGGLVKDMPEPLPAEIKIAEWNTYDQSLSFYTRRRTILVDKIGELVFSATSRDHSNFFLKGEERLRRLAADGPLLVNLCFSDWSRVRQWGILFPVAANSKNLMVANTEFFLLTDLKPWPEEAVKSPPLFLIPRKAALQD